MGGHQHSLTHDDHDDDHDDQYGHYYNLDDPNDMMTLMIMMTIMMTLKTMMTMMTNMMTIMTIMTHDTFYKRVLVVTRSCQLYQVYPVSVAIFVILHSTIFINYLNLEKEALSNQTIR